VGANIPFALLFSITILCLMGESANLLSTGAVDFGIIVDSCVTAGPTPESPPLVRDDRVGQDTPHREQLAPPHGILEPRERELRGQGRPRDRIAVDQQFVDRVVGQPGGVVAVAVATGEPKDSWPEQLERLMLNLTRLPRIVEARGQALGQPEVGINPLEQDRAAVGAGVLRVEDGDHRLIFRIEFERDLRYSYRASVSWRERASNQRFSRTLARLDGCLVSSFPHNPG
jgi:hypothetical protein